MKNLFIDKFNESIDCVLGCFDRVIFRGHLQQLSYATGIEGYVDHVLGIKRKDFPNWAKGLTGQLVRHVEGMAESEGRELVYLNKKTRKDDAAREIAQRDHITEELVCVFKCLESCPSFRMRYGKNRPRLSSLIHGWRCSIST